MPSSPAATLLDWLERLACAVLLAVILVASCVLGFITTYALLPASVFAVLVLLLRFPQPWRPGPMAAVFAGAFVVLGAVFSLSGDYLAVFNFSAFILYAPMAALFARQAATGNARQAAIFAMIGVGLGLLVALWREGHLDIPPYQDNTDRLRLSNTALLLAALAATLGISGGTSRWRWLLLLALPVAAAVVLITGARTGMVSLPVIVIGLALLLPRRWWVGAIAATGALSVLAVVLMLGLGSNRILSLGSTLQQLLASGSSTDTAVQDRLDLYRAGWDAFQHAPAIGYGWGNIMQAIVPFAGDSVDRIKNLPHLHNEVLNFAVGGGLVGVAVLIALLVAPTLIALRSPADSQRSARINSTIILALAYVAMGTTDTMIGFELHTSLYVGLVAIILGWCRDEPPPPTPA
jgi:O-antigen ligase